MTTKKTSKKWGYIYTEQDDKPILINTDHILSIKIDGWNADTCCYWLKLTTGEVYECVLTMDEIHLESDEKAIAKIMEFLGRGDEVENN